MVTRSPTEGRGLLRESALLALCPAAALAGCGSVDLDQVKNRAAMELRGPVAGYFAAPGFAGGSDGKILHAGLSGAGRVGEALSFDLGGFFGIGAGTSGLRLKLLGIETALGAGASPPKLPEVGEEE